MASGSQADVEMEAPIWVLAYIAEPSLKALGFYELKRSQGLHIFDASQIPANVRNRPEVRKPAKVEQVYLMIEPVPVGPAAQALPFSNFGELVDACEPLGRGANWESRVPADARENAYLLAYLAAPESEERAKPKPEPESHTTSGIGWNSIQDVNELFHDWESPSHAAKNENMKANQKILQPAAIYNGRPPNLTGPPVFVYHPVFAKFVSQVRMDVDDFEFKEKDIEITQDICELLAQYHDTEPAMQSAIRPLFEWFFGLQNFGPKKIYSGLRWCEPNGQRLVKLPGLYESTHPGFSYVPSKLSELKLGIGSGGCDPIDQGEKDYQLCCMNPNLDAIRQRSPMPAFLFSLVGPIFCISGLIFVNNQVVSQRLMDYQCFIPLLTYDPGSSRTFRPNEIHVARIAQKLRSLSRCLDELDDYYGSITPKQPTGLSPAPHFRSFQGFDGKTYELAYTNCLAVTPVAQQRAIFLADATTGKETVSCVVKFTSSYGQAAHEHMFQRKAAPRLLYCSREPSAGLLFVVVMEFIKGTLRDSPAAYDRNKIEDLESAVRSLLDQNVVFGDLRAPNLVVGEGGALLLVDFDWSGELNVVRYPPSLNPDAKLWAPGVTRGALIKTEHDIWMMDKLKNELVQSLEAQAGRAEAGAGIKRKRDHNK